MKTGAQIGWLTHLIFGQQLQVIYGDYGLKGAGAAGLGLGLGMKGAFVS